MKTVILIPARFGSSRFPGKPLTLINGQPMIQRVIERAKLVKGADAIYVATDDKRIADAVEQVGAIAVMTDSELPSGTDRINQAAERIGLQDEDIIINLQGDQPLVDPNTLEQLIQLFKAHPGEFSMATLAYQITDPKAIADPNQVKVVFDNQHNALYFSRSTIPFGRDAEDYPIYKHLGIYGYSKGFVDAFAKLPVGRLEALEKLEQLRALENGFKIRIAVSGIDSTEVDTPADVQRAERQLGLE
ncbi:3-deoxy-manno-octulosonate cytidylyltransferase [Paraferrimonas sedimenticola]|uniref:3-deoxy-manno-octulosonate cytidylyltransferase n=1 Tax=Paraferrimonas sedimenticola TaxID=375674 RepID=A0AA37RNR5_9GAMM|nr:3-deoxy-manno-octulosonate cytidylyltransferase [Paraferrimonas sedimenticola]GLP94756.1 8-amino-3,8-dideoxy-manno-octulosonate cytidylyltransferase [Paraferrimonas sedimenticola]